MENKRTQVGKDSQKVEPNKRLYKLVQPIPRQIKFKKNGLKAWKRGYNEKYDMIVISHDGTIGQVYEISGIRIALPMPPKECKSRSDKWDEQYWERDELPKSLARIRTTQQWKETPREFKNQWIDYIDEQFDYREKGMWYMNKDIPTYITGSHWMYVQWSNIDVGYPDMREANRILYIFWEACVIDSRCFGMCYLKIRRSGFSFMSGSEGVNVATLAKKALIGILSKTGKDAKKMFTTKVVPISTGYPFFFSPIQDGMDKPKTEISYRIPAKRITKSNMYDVDDDSDEGLETVIDWRNTADNSYDSEKLLLLLHDESGKWEKPVNILENWRVTKTCLRLGSRIKGKTMMGSTCNAQQKGGKEFKQLYNESKVHTRNKNGRTKSGMYSLFIPMEHNMEGHIDRYGFPVMYTPDEPVMGVDGEWITKGAIDWWQDEVDSLSDDPDAKNEFLRQNPRTESHAFRDEAKESIFDLTKIYDQIEYNDGLIMNHHLSVGNFKWRNGVLDSEVEWHPDPKGRFIISWHPPASLRHILTRGADGLFHPPNVHVGAFGADTYDISGVVGGGGSKGAMHGLCGFSMEEAPSNQFFLEYIARPATAEIMFEDMLMAMVYYGMPILAENNKPRFLYHLKMRGYRPYSINRPDKHYTKLSQTEKELGGIPNSADSVKQAHAMAIESFIDKFVGYDLKEQERPADEIGSMLFNRTLYDWAGFDINNRTKYDASISSGLSIMATQKHLYHRAEVVKKISCNFGTYDNNGNSSKLIYK